MENINISAFDLVNFTFMQYKKFNNIKKTNMIPSGKLY